LGCSVCKRFAAWKADSAIITLVKWRSLRDAFNRAFGFDKMKQRGAAPNVITDSSRISAGPSNKIQFVLLLFR
jgi:hypothetical protein